jgi:peptidyl-prolyl cis-trans isomerase A (cyclophilin A)
MAMANAGPNTGSCQFFFTEAPTPHLNQLHTIFGQVVEGQDLIGQIARVPTNQDKPVTPVLIEKVTITRVRAAAAPKPAAAKAPAAVKPKPAAKKN